MLYCLASGILAFVAQPNTIYVYVDLPGMCAPLSTISYLLMVIPYQPDVILYSEIDRTVALF